mgnify:CR=1 FL=1
MDFKPDMGRCETCEWEGPIDLLNIWYDHGSDEVDGYHFHECPVCASGVFDPWSSIQVCLNKAEKECKEKS